jgi:uncharacterized protein
MACGTAFAERHSQDPPSQGLAAVWWRQNTASMLKETAMLVDELKARIKQAMRDKNDTEKEVLRVVLGEIQTEEHRTGKDATDEEAMAYIRKLIKSNDETLKVAKDEVQRATLEKENDILKGFLPASLSPEQIAQALIPVMEAIKGAKSDGQATGVAMKELKKAGAVVDGKDVALAIKTMRAGA